MAGADQRARTKYPTTIEARMTKMNSNLMVMPTKQNDRVRLGSALRAYDQAMLRYSEGDTDQAESLFQRALKMLEQAEGDNHPDVGRALNTLGAIYENACNYRKAGRCYRRSVRIMTHFSGDTTREIVRLRVQSLQNLGRINLMTGRFAKAEPLLRTSLATTEEAFGRREH
jgi:tetratricopeptide (TPR) repeat protein